MSNLYQNLTLKNIYMKFENIETFINLKIKLYDLKL